MVVAAGEGLGLCEGAAAVLQGIGLLPKPKRCQTRDSESLTTDRFVSCKQSLTPDIEKPPQ